MRWLHLFRKLREATPGSEDLLPEAEQAQLVEVRRRMAQVESGEVVLVPGDEGLAQVRENFSRIPKNEEFLFYGELVAPDGLSVLRGAFAKDSSIEVVQSGYDFTLYLHARAQGFDLEMDSGQRDSFVFSGGVDGDAEYAKFRVAQISTGLCNVGLTHRIELYGKHRQIAYFHYRWPQTSPPDDE